jgi:hypothetical protein
MRRLLVVAALALSVGACDSGPDGPGDLAGQVQSPAPSLGGAVFEVVGSGIEGFSGAGGTRVFWARQDNPVAYRVIVLGDGGGELAFTATVKERGGRLPRSTVVSAVDTENRPLPVTKDFKVKFSR